ncbi:hypothetical protein NicSoilB8_32530 [Arthrobacter sp. NicSoilB8]|nr:hypothetical protein NicSoilB8_32530 [Arthrobacter sp. NicSoilB8]
MGPRGAARKRAGGVGCRACVEASAGWLGRACVEASAGWLGRACVEASAGWLGRAAGRDRNNDMACIGALRAQKYRIHCFHLPVVCPLLDSAGAGPGGSYRIAKRPAPG